MAKRNPEVDAYIEKSADFARPILKKIRKLFHQACPKLTEEMKWGAPHFVYKGIVGGMAAFKQHAAIGFWKANLMSDPQGLFKQIGQSDMGRINLTSLKDMPSDDVLLAYMQQAVELNEQEIKPTKKPTKLRTELVVPDDLLVLLKKNRKAAATFEAFSYSHRKEYVEWIEEAKRPETRAKRLAATVEMLSEGKSRNWKYEKC